MELTSLHSQLKTKQLSDFYIFTGPEWLVQNKYIEQISKLSRLEKRYIESIADVYGKIKHPTKLSKNYLYVVRDDKELMQNEKLQNELSNGLLGKNILVLLLTSVDKRTKFYKSYNNVICDFEALKPDMLIKYLQRESKLSTSQLGRLIEVCENDYGRCLLEIDKIERSGKELEELLKDGTIYIPPKDAIFDFVDAILNHQVSKVFELYENCKAVGEATMVMITVLYDNAKAVLQVQSCESRDVAKTTGLSTWQIRNAKEHCGVYRNSELLNIMHLCRYCETGIKKGILEESIAMDYILVNIL